jgi:hypothetical protein
MYPNFTKIPGLVRVNRLLQVHLNAPPSVSPAFPFVACAQTPQFSGCLERREPLHQPHFRLAF